MRTRYFEALKSPEYRDVDEQLANQFFDFYHKKENSIEASESWYDTSCRSFPEYWYCEGDQLLNWKERGYCAVFDLLQASWMSLGDDQLAYSLNNVQPHLFQKRIPLTKRSLDITTCTKLNQKVLKIAYDGPSNLGSVRVACCDGSAYTADHVICTVSLGVLKEKHLSLFEPHLPPSKIRCIEGLSIGTVDKIFVEFPQPFWSTGWQGFSILWCARELQSIREDAEFNWLEDVFGFFTVDYQPNILCGWITGPNARRMEQVSEAALKEGVMRLLRTFLKNWQLPEPIHLIRFAFCLPSAAALLTVLL